MNTEMETMYESLGISKKVLEFGTQIEEHLKERFEEIDKRAEFNQMKVIKAMQDNRVSDIHFAATTGYGYNDLGRDTLEAVYASAFHGESALVRPQLTCGTHALAVALASNLRPGDELLSPVGKPYDTLEEVVGLRGEGHGSLKEWGVTFQMQELAADGHIDFDAIPAAVQGARVAYIQRSRGYTLRPSVTVAEIARVVELVKAQHEKAVRILTDSRAKLDELAQYLYQKETITGEEFMEILNREPAQAQ